MIGCWITAVSSVFAHAALLETHPADGEIVQVTPEALVLTFNEPLEPERTEVLLFDWNGRSIPISQGESGERSEKVTRELPALRDGTYTVVWKVISADGHPIEGSFSFSVGKENDETVAIAAGSGWIETGYTLSRFGLEGLILLGAGFYWTAFFAARQGLPGFATLLGAGRFWGGAAIVGGMLLSLSFYSALLPGPSLFRLILEGRWEWVFQSPAVVILFLQLILLLLLVIPDMTAGWYLVIWILFATTPAFGGHIWGMEHPWTAGGLRMIHLWMVAAWLGGLSYLLLAGWHASRHRLAWDWHRFRPFIGWVAMVAAGFAISSGMVMILLQTDIRSAFLSGAIWSTLLWVKVLLTLVMLLVGWGLSRDWSRHPANLPWRHVRLEWIVGVTVLLAGVWMSQSPYPLPERAYVEEIPADRGEVKAGFQLARLQIGTQTGTLSWDVKKTGEPERVEVRLSMPEHGMQGEPIAAERVDPGRYQAPISLTMVGEWEVEWVATLPEGKEIRWKDQMFVPGGGL